MTSATATAPSAGPNTKTFSDFGVDEHICAALTEAGITTPFPIQELTLPLALSGADLIGQARTGTGKTLAFGIPMLQRLDRARAGVQGLVIVPTRELCLQVAEDLASAGAKLDVSVVACYGGKAIDAQIAALRAGADVVVGTPGRLLDLLGRGELDLSGAAGLVLDEADEMLDLGFLPDVEQLIAATAEQRQTLLFSATMPSAVVSLARRYMTKPTFMRAEVEEVRVAPETEQHFFACHRMDKPAILARILQAPGRGLCVVFTRTKRMADTLAEELRERSVDAAAIHSDLRQDARERALRRFREGKTTVLVATEVAARGLDIDDVTHVVNYDCPDDEKMYLHRIGRTGRAGAAGVAVTLAVWNELARVEMIKRQLDIDVPTHEVFSTSPILDELFDLPARQARRPRFTAHGARRQPSSSQEDGDGRASQAADAREATEAQADTVEAEEDTQAAPQGGRRRRAARTRRRGRDQGSQASASGGTASGEPASEQAPLPETPASDTAPAQTPAPATHAADRAQEEGAEAAVRTRRRVRQRAGAPAPDVTPEPAVSAATAPVHADEAADTQDAERHEAGAGTSSTEVARRTRVRRRLRQDERDVGTPGGTGTASAADGSQEEPSTEVPSAGKEEPAGRRARGGNSSPRGSSKGDSGAGGSTTRSAGTSNRGGGGARRGSRRGQSNARGSGRGRRAEPTGSRGSDQRGPAAPPPSTEQIRGDGRPRLNRPLVVTHLP